MKRVIRQYVERFFHSQVSTIKHIKKPLLLQPHEVPNSKFESMSMDFIMSLPNPQSGYDTIFVIVNCLTKITQFKPTVTIAATSCVVNLFMKIVFEIYGMPSEIVGDWDLKLLSEVLPHSSTGDVKNPPTNF